MKNKIVRPKIRLNTSPEAIRLNAEECSIAERLHEISGLSNKSTESSYLLEKLRLLKIDSNKALFRAAMGKDLDTIERIAFSDDDINGVEKKNSWLYLLRWNITYMARKEFQTLIVLAHSLQKPSDMRFLEEVAHILRTPRKCPFLDTTRKPPDDAYKFEGMVETFNPKGTVGGNAALASLWATDKSGKEIAVTERYCNRRGVGKKARMKAPK